MSEWQPIETAPKDGTRHVRGLWVTVTSGDRPTRKEWHEYVGYVSDDGRFVDPDYSDDFGWYANDFTHWTALPPPPPST